MKKLFSILTVLLAFTIIVNGQNQTFSNTNGEVRILPTDSLGNTGIVMQNQKDSLSGGVVYLDATTDSTAYPDFQTRISTNDKGDFNLANRGNGSTTISNRGEMKLQINDNNQNVDMLLSDTDHHAQLMVQASDSMLASTTLKTGNKYWETSVAGINSPFTLLKDKFILSHNNGNSWKRTLVATPNGNIGIGTISPSSRLTVISDQPSNGIRVGRVGSGVNLNVFSDLYEAGIGTKSNHPFRLITNNSVRMQIAKNGNIGMGTVNPSQELHVYRNDSKNADLRLQNTNGGAFDVFSGTNYCGLWSYGNKTMRFATNSKERMRITSSGYIGMGTSSPSQELHVYRNDNYNADLRLQNKTGKAFDVFSGTTTCGLWSYGTKTMKFATNGIERMKIDRYGRVGIGTSTIPNGYKLAVDGKVICEEMKVQLSQNWPDYVFAAGYNLKSLEEVEATIQKEGHLPGVKSAQEIENEGGVELGAMTFNQQEKIEEIYLHLIEMNKTVKELKTENEQLKAEVNALKTK